jgi:hypothetical protein
MDVSGWNEQKDDIFATDELQADELQLIIPRRSIYLEHDDDV